MQTRCIEMALMSQQEKENFEQELLNAIRQDRIASKKQKHYCFLRKLLKILKRNKDLPIQFTFFLTLFFVTAWYFYT
jgi:hypothetical protein